MTHLVGNDIVQSSVCFHVRQVGRVERHLSFSWKKSGGSGRTRPQYARTRLTQDGADSVDRGSLRKDHEIVDEIAVIVEDIGQIADNGPGPTIRRRLKGSFLTLGQATQETNLNRVARNGCSPSGHPGRWYFDTFARTISFNSHGTPLSKATLPHQELRVEQSKSDLG